MNRSSCSTNYKKRYVSPLERLARRNNKWRTAKKIQKEEELEELCRQGKLQTFKPPENYSLFFINRTTDIFIIDNLIDQAKITNHYSIDTENDPITQRPATIQAEFIQHHTSSTIIIIEANHLPETNSPLFKKIQNLCSNIFTKNNRIYSWGPAKDELKKFVPFNLFINDILIDEQDLQFQHDSYIKYGLQNMIIDEFGQFLPKTYTLAEWACGLDLSLRQHIPEGVSGSEFIYQVNEETKYRQEAIKYAVNDVFAVTKLAFIKDEQLFSTPPPTAEQDETNYEESIDLQQEPVVELQLLSDEIIIDVGDEKLEEEINEQDQLHYNAQIGMENKLFFSDNILENYGNIQNNEPDYYESMEVHVLDGQSTLNINPDDGILPEIMKLHFNNELINISDDESLPEYMKLHLPIREQQDEPKKVHVEFQGRFYNVLDPEEAKLLKKLRNRVTNRQHRANRYNYEVIRRCYYKFSITEIKRILKSMNIIYININMNRRKLYIGLKNQAIVDEVERQLHDRIFTEQHYDRLHPRRN